MTKRARPRLLPSFLSLFLALCMLCGSAALARAEAPRLDGVFPSDDTLTLGKTVLQVEFVANVAGTLTVAARARGSGDAPQPVEEREVSAGAGVAAWDGVLGGQNVAPGPWELFLTLRDGQGDESPACAAVVEVVGAAPRPTLTPKEARPKIEPGPDRQLSEFNDPHGECFWNMDIDNLDPEDPEDQRVIWEIMMQPITVLDVGPKEHIYALSSPDADPKDAKNYTIQLSGTTQGLHVIESLPSGWSLVEAYGNDGYKSPNKELRKLAGKLLSGYVRTDKLKTVTPDKHTGLLIDKLRQRMYVFQDGVVTGELLVSTGRPTKDQPYSETPAGEMLTDSRVGLFMNGNMYCDMAIRICDGTLIHEVPYLLQGDGSKNYDPFVAYLGRKASHGCVRVQKDLNEQGMNMRWLWNNIKRYTKVLIWDDTGRTLPPPDPALPVFYNPDGGKNYHLNQMCRGVKDRFLPLTEFLYGELNNSPYDKLTPCATCNPPNRHEDESLYFVPDEIIGTEVDE